MKNNLPLTNIEKFETNIAPWHMISYETFRHALFGDYTIHFTVKDKRSEGIVLKYKEHFNLTKSYILKHE